YGITTTATDLSTGSTSEFSYCRPASSPNLAWVNAQPLTSGQTADQFITDNLQEKWFKIAVNPGDKVKVQLNGAPGSAVSLHRDPAPFYNALTNPSSAAALSAEAADNAFLPSGSLPSGSLPSGSLPSGSLPSGSLPSGSLERGFLPSGSLPSGSLPSGSLPSGSLPSGSLPSGSLPSGSLPSGSLPSGSLPSGSLPSGSLPSGSLPSGSLPSGSLQSGSLPSGSLDAYASASRKSLMGISMDPYAQVQTIERTTFDLQESLYVRVVGPYNVTTPFTVSVTVTGGVCSNLTPISSSLPIIVGTAPGNAGLQTVIVTDQTRMSGSPADKATAMTSLTTLANRTDVQGVVIDLSDTTKYPRVAAANAQADANPACPVAKNTVAKEIKAVIDAYRKANTPTGGATTLQYVVLAGGADVVPFYQVQDVAGLANEKDYVPPVKPETPTDAGLRSGLVKGQDYYGSAVDLTINSRTLAVPDLAVGRLVDNATDITAAVNAYIATGGVVAPNTSLVTGYDFVGDAAGQVRDELAAGTTTTPDTLIQPQGEGANGPNVWNADQLRAKLLAGNHGITMLAGHFSAGTLLAADYKTGLSAADISASAASFTNSVVLALGCHGGFAVPSTDLLAGASPDPDWAKTFMRKGAAAYVAATGYAYGDTELTEYGERLFVGLTKQMRTGTGPISMGKALVEAKRDYLASTAQLTGIDEKTVVEMTLYGLPMMKVNMPGTRLSPPADASLVGTTAAVSPAPVVATGLRSTTVALAPALTPHNVPLIDVTNGTTTATTYYSGPDGVVSNPFEPILPKKIDNVSASGQVLRGVAFRGGDYADVNGVTPLTSAPTTETSTPHQSFNSDVFYPNQVWMPNFYDAVDGGSTRLVTIPAQYRSSAPGSTTGTIRTFSNVNMALYYMPSDWTAAGSDRAAKGAAVSAGPSVNGVSASVSGQTVTFSVNAKSDGSAGVQAVWVLYTADPGSSFYGHWAPVDLIQDHPDPAHPEHLVDPTLWTGTLDITGTPASSMHFMVQAVNGAGLTALATNLGGYYPVAGSATPPAPATTAVTLNGPSSGTFQTAQTFTATLKTPDSSGTGVSGQAVVFDIGGQQVSALTNASGQATVTLTPSVPPVSYTAQVSSRPSVGFASATTSKPFTVTKA
ncbi:MAG: hypothetical protein JWN99_876, partial [Ilumatobacteraceae bacterium]|nr:hypothetical protein [Ilumatobacteraceae bacterium]